MLYHPELFYFFDTPGFSFAQSFIITAQVVGSWSTSYRTAILARKPGVLAEIREGTLQPDPRARREQIAVLIAWIMENSEMSSQFSFHLMKDNPPGNETGDVFSYDDDASCWVLSLNETEFGKLQERWTAEGLPGDLFFREDQWHDEAINQGTLFGGLVTYAGGTIHTPKRWKAHLLATRQGNQDLK